MNFTSSLKISFFFLFFRSRIEKVNYRHKEKQILDNILGKGIDGTGYDKRIRPSGNNDTGLYIIAVNKIIYIDLPIHVLCVNK